MRPIPQISERVQLYSFESVSRHGPLLLALSMLAVVGAPVACNGEPKLSTGGGPRCETKGDCEAGEVCSFQGICRTGCGAGEECGAGQFCATSGSCESQCTGCGTVCAATADCPAGQYCTDGSCQRECDPSIDNNRCGLLVCSADGQCVGDSDIVIGEDSGGGMGGEGNGGCIDVYVTFEPQIPNVVLLIDRSGTMNAGGGFGNAVNEAIGDGSYTAWDCAEPTWRYNVVRNILLNPRDGIVKPLENDVRFGMALYSSPEDAMETCPQILQVDLGFGTHADMLAEFNCEDYLTHTPSRESMTATAEKLAAMDVEGPKVIVFATDGDPDSCECRNWDDGYGTECDQNDPDNDIMLDGVTLNTAEAERFRVVQEARRINEDLGITIEVIDVSRPDNNGKPPDQGLRGHLNDVAEHGGAVSGAAIDGFNPGALADAFQAIIDGVRSCAIDLDGEIERGKESTGRVTLNGDELILNGPDGWVVNSPTQIELLGGACEMIKSGDHELDVSFPCGAFKPVVLRATTP